MKNQKLETASILQVMSSEVERLITKYKKKGLQSFFITSVLYNAADAERFLNYTHNLEKHRKEQNETKSAKG